LADRQQAEQTNRPRTEPDRCAHIFLTQPVQNATPEVEAEALEQKGYG
jgi:hypothetical protein